ncbi:MAG: hypothetical protein HC897_04850 [Thermoanaerobaculia bacterium]|nr:hypothetical protein [Thermoanaerobaculia bacterium]
MRVHLAQGSELLGKTLRELRFRGRFGLVVVGLARDGAILSEDLADEPLRPDDGILALADRRRIGELATHPDLVIDQVGLSALSGLAESLSLLHVPPGSPLVGATVGESRLGELVGLTIAGIIRGGETHLAVAPDRIIEAGDRLLIAGSSERMVRVLALGELEPRSEVAQSELESEEVGVVEVTIAPRSQVVGRTLADLSFRDRYGLQVLALWREGRPVRTRLAQQPLRFGDALLLQGSYERIRRLAEESDFVVLSDLARVSRRLRKAPYAVGGLALMIALVVTGLQPIHVAAFMAATLVILAGALEMREAYRAIEWRAIFLVAAVLPVGFAMERTGAAELLAHSVGKVEALGPYAVLAALVVLSSLLSQGLDGAPAVVLMTPW